MASALPADNADATATVAASLVSPGVPHFEVEAACPDCGVRQTFKGTVPEISDAAEVWKQGHQCVARLGGSGSTVVTNGKDVRLPGIG